MGSLSNLGTPQPSYRNLADGLSGSYTPTPVYRRYYHQPYDFRDHR